MKAKAMKWKESKVGYMGGFGGRKKGGGMGKDIWPRRTKDCLWIERRQMWTIGKWQFIKVKWETLCQDEVFNFNWAC